MKDQIEILSREISHLVAILATNRGIDAEELINSIKFSEYSLGDPDEPLAAIKFFHPHYGTLLGDALNTILNNAGSIAGYHLKTFADTESEFNML